MCLAPDFQVQNLYALKQDSKLFCKNVLLVCFVVYELHGDKTTCN